MYTRATTYFCTQTPVSFLPRRHPDPRLGWVGGDPISSCICLDFLISLDFILRPTGPRRYAIVLGVKFQVECGQNHVWGPLGARDLSIFVKHVFLVAEIALGNNHC